MVPPRVEYELTELGQGLGPVFLALLDWSRLRRSQAAADVGEVRAS
jgi:DNA-binding HxlR family transcriptional regulator